MSGNKRCGKCSLIYKGFIVLAAIVGILLQCGLGTGRFSFISFRMFTTLSNLAVALFFIVYITVNLASTGLSAKSSKALRYFKFLITMSIMLTGLVAHFMLRGMFANMGVTAKVGLTLLHYVVPIATFLDWILFDEKGKTEWKMPLFAALFPIIYVAISMIAAQFISGEDKYPYPFLNIDTLGIAMVLVNILLLAVAFLAVGFIGVWADHKLSRKKT